MGKMDYYSRDQLYCQFTSLNWWVSRRTSRFCNERLFTLSIWGILILLKLEEAVDFLKVVWIEDE